LFLALNSQIWAIYLRICFVCNEAKYYESKTMRHGPKILGGSEKRPKANAKTDRIIKKKKGALDKYFNHGGYTLNATPH